METAKRYCERSQNMYNAASEYRQLWHALNEYLFPFSGSGLRNKQDDNSGLGSSKKTLNQRDRKILNSTANYARLVYSNGMTGGTTSSTRPWFRIALPDRDLMEFKPVKEWLHETRLRMMYALQRSNFYDAIANMHEEIGVYGWNPMIIDEDPKYMIRCRPMTIGEAYIALDENQRPATLYRSFYMTVEQLVKRFAWAPAGKEPQRVNRTGEGLPHTIWKLWKDGKLDERVQVLHVIERRTTWPEHQIGPKAMPWASIYMLKDGNKRGDKGKDAEYLEVSGYMSQPFVAPRFKTTGTQVYGNSCPGIEALADVKMLQKMEKDKLMGLDRQVNPPMNAPAMMKKTGGGSTLPGAVNFVDIMQGQQGFTPTLQVNPDLNGLMVTIQEVEARIRRHFGVDLFLMMSSEEKNMTATEVARRQTEKLHQLGPALTRFNHEGLDPIIDRVFTVMLGRGEIPPPPEEMQGMELSIEYTSLLAEAQRIADVPAIEQFSSFTGGLMAVAPEAGDKVNWDEMVDLAGERFSVPPEVIRTDEEVAQMRQERARQQQAAQMVQNAESMAGSAKTLSETTVGDESVLDRMLGGIG